MVTPFLTEAAPTNFDEDIRWDVLTDHSRCYRGFPPTLIGLALEKSLDGLDMELEKRYCCPPEDAKKWTNCHWYGKPGSCFDNHCNIGHQVQLATSADGQGESCAPHLERDRVFCCDPTHGRSPFLPVPLDYLFPHPPTGASVATDFDLKVDNAWGDGHADTADDKLSV